MAEVVELVVDPSDALEHAATVAERIEASLRERLTFFTGELADEVRINLSGKVLNIRTAFLIGSVKRTGPESDGTTLEAGVVAGGPDAPYGVYHEFGGTAPYPIKAIRGNFLKFEMGGRTVFARQVMHPATIKRPWFGPAVEMVAPKIGPALQAAIDEVIAE